MTQTPPEVKFANLLFILFWIVIVLVFWIFGRRWQATRAFRERMIAGSKPSLSIALLFGVSMGIAGRGWLNPFAVAIFCQALVGLALARGIPDHEPLPVVRSVIQRDRPLRAIALMLGVALAAVILEFVVGNIGMGIVQRLVGETAKSEEAMQSFVPSAWQAFSQLLAGAGIAEETTYRLVCIPFIWRLSGRRWFAIITSAVLFGAYHLSPLDGLYRTFWQSPISQFITTVLIGLIWGYVYVKRGYETSVLAHTLSDWIPFVIFSS